MRPCACSLITCALLALAACHKPRAARRRTKPRRRPRRARSRASTASHKGKPAPDAAFNDPDGGEISLADFKGKPVLVNLWATWCAPCVKELPTLDRLPGAPRDGGCSVVAISQDSGPHASVVAFLASAPDRRSRRLSGSRRWRCRARSGRTRCCRPRSCSTRRARKSGATSATSTGPARKRLSCWPKPARRETS